MDRSLCPPLLQTVRATFMAHGSSVMRPLSSGHPPAVYNSWGTCDLTVHASPLWDIAPSRQGAGSSAYAARLRPITSTSPSARQPIRGITPGLASCGIPHDTPYGWHLLTTIGERTCRVTPFPASILRIRRTVFSTGFLYMQAGQWMRLPAPYPVPFWLQRVSLLRWDCINDGSSHLCLRCP